MIEEKLNKLYRNQKLSPRKRIYTNSYFNPLTFIIGIFGFMIFWKYFDPLKINDNNPKPKDQGFEKEYISKHF